ncbi:hypothetical protein BC827DRAFT_563773 [Russula dissimulans]|nr:hypothetical protein BC827DRAFT_563773 [Russula dissimulans]
MAISPTCQDRLSLSQTFQKEVFPPSFDFIRDRSRAVRNDSMMQRETRPLAIECHERCARFHILVALQFEPLPRVLYFVGGAAVDEQ